MEAIHASAKAPGSSPNHDFATVFSGVWTGETGAAGGTFAGSVAGLDSTGDEQAGMVSAACTISTATIARSVVAARKILVITRVPFVRG